LFLVVCKRLNWQPGTSNQRGGKNISDNATHIAPGESAKHLDKGLIIFIKRMKDFEPVMTVVKFAIGNKLYFRFPKSFLNTPLEIGQEFSAQVMNTDCEYVLHGKISSLEMEDIPRIEYEIESIIRYEERREHKRHYINLPALMTFPKSETKIYIIIKNISIAGSSVSVGIMLRDKPDSENYNKVHISASLKDTSILEFEAKLGWSQKHEDFEEFGMDIISISEANVKILKNMIFSLQKDNHLFIEKELKI
jgi:hypothetical protein